jgi:hypothetical protein
MNPWASIRPQRSEIGHPALKTSPAKRRHFRVALRKLCPAGHNVSSLLIDMYLLRGLQNASDF